MEKAVYQTILEQYQNLSDSFFQKLYELSLDASLGKDDLNTELLIDDLQGVMNGYSMLTALPSAIDDEHTDVHNTIVRLAALIRDHIAGILFQSHENDAASVSLNLLHCAFRLYDIENVLKNLAYSGRYDFGKEETKNESAQSGTEQVPD